MHLDRTGLEILGQDECRALLDRAEVGRVVFTHHALPAVQPVAFVLHGDRIVFRTSRSSRLAAAAGAIVAFEADDLDTATRTGWSVVAVGPARRATACAEIGELAALPLPRWAPGERDRFIVVTPRLLTGRRIPRRRDALTEPRP